MKSTTPCIIDAIRDKLQTALIIFEDELFIAFLDHRPVFLGHTLVCPKAHFQTFYDIPPEILPGLFTCAQRIGKAVEKAMGAQGSFIAINNKISQSIPHVHIHVIPRKKGDGLKGFFWPRMTYRDETHQKEIQNQIIQAL